MQEKAERGGNRAAPTDTRDVKSSIPRGIEKEARHVDAAECQYAGEEGLQQERKGDLPEVTDELDGHGDDERNLQTVQ